MGRPSIGNGSNTIALTVEKELLARADAYARKHGISRAKLVAQGLRAIIGPDRSRHPQAPGLPSNIPSIASNRAPRSSHTANRTRSRPPDDSYSETPA